jgi:hypothetical protein
VISSAEAPSRGHDRHPERKRGLWDLGWRESATPSEVFEFGRFNLYTRFNPRGAQDEYESLSKLFHRAGIDSPRIEEFSGF